MLRHQTINSVSSSTILSDGIYFSSSTGQNSVSGNFFKSSIIISQGFQKYLYSFEPSELALDKNETIIVYPNPFEYNLNIKLPETLYGFNVMIRDFSGTTIFNKKFSNPTNFLELFPGYLTTGSYALFVISNDKIYSSIIIKK